MWHDYLVFSSEMKSLKDLPLKFERRKDKTPLLHRISRLRSLVPHKRINQWQTSLITWSCRLTNQKSRCILSIFCHLLTISILYISFPLFTFIKSLYRSAMFILSLFLPLHLSLSHSASLSLSLSLLYIHCTYSSIDVSLSLDFIFWLLIFCVDCF